MSAMPARVHRCAGVGLGAAQVSRGVADQRAPGRALAYALAEPSPIACSISALSIRSAVAKRSAV